MAEGPGSTAGAVLVSVIVVNYNAGDLLLRCLGDLSRQTRSDFEAIVVDNESKDGSFERARAAIVDARFRFDHMGGNLGFAAANNAAARSARGTWIALLNPDAFPAPDWLERLLQAAERHVDVATFGSLQLFDDAPHLVDGAGDRYLAYGQPWRDLHGMPRDLVLSGDVDQFSACAAASLIRADLFRQAGGFDERFFCYCEDVDLGFRLALAGWRSMICTEAVVLHRGGASAPSGDFAAYHGVRNLIWTYAKNMPGILLWATAPGFIALLAAHIAAAMVRGKAAVVLRALRDGFAAWFSMRADGAPARDRCSIGALARRFDWNPITFAWRRRRRAVRI